MPATVPMVTKAPPRSSSSSAPTQEQLDLWNTMCRERGLDHLVVTHFPAGTRFGDAGKLLDKLKQVPLLPGVNPAYPDHITRLATPDQVGYILRLQAQVGDEVGVPEDLLRIKASRWIDSLKARREKMACT